MRIDRTGLVAAAVAHDFNNELTVILTSVTESLRGMESDHPSRPYLLELRAAAQRCTWKASGLLNFCARNHHLPVRASFESLTKA
jgi:hypothetical protein